MFQTYSIELTYASIYVNIFLHLFLASYNYLYLLYDMAKKKGRPAAEDKREPFNLRIRKSILTALRDRAKNEQRAMNTIAENILEKELK